MCNMLPNKFTQHPTRGISTMVIYLTPVNGKNPCTLFSTGLMGISTLVVYVTT